MNSKQSVKTCANGRLNTKMEFGMKSKIKS